MEWRGREWSGGKGRAGQGRVPDCLGGLSRVGISSRSTRPWNGQPPSYYYNYDPSTSSWKTSASSSHPVSVPTKPATFCVVHSVTSAAQCWSAPGSNLECWSQHSDRSLVGLGNMADMKTLWCMPSRNTYSASTETSH